MSLTTDPNDPDLHKVRPNGQNEKYLVLSTEERLKGFTRPYRDQYIHIKPVPKFPLRDLTVEEMKDNTEGYVKYEEYPESMRPSCGRYWTAEQLRACGAKTTMARALSETYARNPKFYGATFCATCGKHFPVAEFVWTDGQTVGS